MLANLLRTSFSNAPKLYQSRYFSRSALLTKGHSKWQNIKETKGKNDAIKARQITFLLRKVKSAVKSGGFDIKLNKQLADVQQEFRARSLPMDSFTSTLTKLKNKPEVIIHYELIGPSGSFFIIEAETDSPGRTRQALSKFVHKIGGFRFTNDLKKRFEEKIIATVVGKRDSKELSLEEVEEAAIELDCEEVDKQGEDPDLEPKFELKFDLRNITTLEEALRAKGLEVENIEQRYIPLHKVALTAEETQVIEKFYSLLDQLEDITNIYDNVE